MQTLLEIAMTEVVQEDMFQIVDLNLVFNETFFKFMKESLYRVERMGHRILAKLTALRHLVVTFPSTLDFHSRRKASLVAGGLALALILPRETYESTVPGKRRWSPATRQGMAVADEMIENAVVGPVVGSVSRAVHDEY